jgi:hypothetical protein
MLAWVISLYPSIDTIYSNKYNPRGFMILTPETRISTHVHIPLAHRPNPPLLGR